MRAARAHVALRPQRTSLAQGDGRSGLSGEGVSVIRSRGGQHLVEEAAEDLGARRAGGVAEVVDLFWIGGGVVESAGTGWVAGAVEEEKGRMDAGEPGSRIQELIL